MPHSPTRNRAFSRIKPAFGPLIDRDHFGGRNAFNIQRDYQKGQPAANIRTRGRLLELELAVPGYRKEEIEILVQDDLLKIRGEKNNKGKTESSQYILEEFDLETFERCFRLADGVGHEKITATLRNGILRLLFVDVPEAEERAFQKITVG